LSSFWLSPTAYIIHLHRSFGTVCKCTEKKLSGLQQSGESTRKNKEEGEEEEEERTVYAVKLIETTDLSEDDETIKKEINILKKCNSPSIVRYFGCYIKQNLLWVSAASFYNPIMS